MKAPVGLVDDAGQVFALFDVAHLEPVGLHVLNQVAGSVRVVPHGQRVDFILLDQGGEPVVNVVVIDVVLPAERQQAAALVDLIGQVVPGGRVLDPRRRQEEMGDHKELPVLLHHDAAGRKVRALGKVDPADAVAAAETVQGDRVAGGRFHDLSRQPGLRAVLLDAGILG